MRPKLERRPQQVAVCGDLHEVREIFRHRLAVLPIEFRLRIERIHVARPAMLEELNDGFRSRLKMMAVCVA